MRFVNVALSIVFLLLCLQNVQAQKFGYVDSKFILSKMPEYQEAQQEIESLSAAWQNDYSNGR